MGFERILPVLCYNRVSQDVDLFLASLGPSIALERGFAHRRAILFLLSFAAHDDGFNSAVVTLRNEVDPSPVELFKAVRSISAIPKVKHTKKIPCAKRSNSANAWRDESPYLCRASPT